MTDNYNFQMVVIDTMKGTAKSKEQLKKVWENRLKKIAPHYRVVGVVIKKGQGVER